MLCSQTLLPGALVMPLADTKAQSRRLFAQRQVMLQVSHSAMYTMNRESMKKISMNISKQGVIKHEKRTQKACPVLYSRVAARHHDAYTAPHQLSYR